MARALNLLMTIKFTQLRASVTSLIARDVNADSRSDVGREGFSDWEITIIGRGKSLLETKGMGIDQWLKTKELLGWIALTEQVCDTARRRVILGETVPNTEKLFSLFETHTQLYRRGKAGTPNQFGRLLLVYEDKAGFISHYHLLARDAKDASVVVAQTQRVQELHDGEIEKASFDRGFYAPESEIALSQILSSPCVPPRHPTQFAEKLKEASLEFHKSRKRHPGIESAIGSLQSGNGLKRCRDRSELGLERYVALLSSVVTCILLAS